MQPSSINIFICIWCLMLVMCIYIVTCTVKESLSLGDLEDKLNLVWLLGLEAWALTLKVVSLFLVLVLRLLVLEVLLNLCTAIMSTLQHSYYNLLQSLCRYWVDIEVEMRVLKQPRRKCQVEILLSEIIWSMMVWGRAPCQNWYAAHSEISSISHTHISRLRTMD